MLDMIQPKIPGKISLSDLKRCKMTPIFFDTFFNLEKYLDHEQRDPFASQRDHENDVSIRGLIRGDVERFFLFKATVYGNCRRTCFRCPTGIDMLPKNTNYWWPKKVVMIIATMCKLVSYFSFHKTNEFGGDSCVNLLTGDLHVFFNFFRVYISTIRNLNVFSYFIVIYRQYAGESLGGGEGDGMW